MPNISNVTNPVPGQEVSSYKPSVTPNDTQIQNVPDPSRVGRSDSRTEREDTATSSGARRYDSNFQAFLNSLRDTGSISEMLTRFLISRPGVLVTSGMSAGISQEIAELLKMLKVDEKELAALLRGQLSASTRFGSELFQALRDALKQNASASLQNDILQFLKKYNDFSSTPHVERNIQRLIKQMSWFMPERFSAPLNEQLSQLENLLSSGNRSGALKLLQNGIIPYMSNYVSQMHERGIARNLLGMLVLDIARFQNGSPDELLQSFYKLLGYSAVKNSLGNPDANEVLSMLQQNAENANSAPSPLPDLLAQITNRSMLGETNADMKQSLKALVDSILLNQSVYMPLSHAILPVEMENRMMFSEIWVDPDDDSNSSGGKYQRSMRLLLKFDIQDLGFFDLIIAYREDDTIDLAINCPPHLSEFNKIFEEKLSELATKDGLKTSNIKASAMVKPLSISEVFPKIFERKDSINVSI